MNRHFSILLSSVLLITALLPLFVAPSESATLPTTQPASPGSSQLLAFGSGIPASRGSGGTR